jgi:hypothetical protein
MVTHERLSRREMHEEADQNKGDEYWSGAYLDAFTFNRHEAQGTIGQYQRIVSFHLRTLMLLCRPTVVRTSTNYTI